MKISFKKWRERIVVSEIPLVDRTEHLYRNAALNLFSLSAVTAILLILLVGKVPSEKLAIWGILLFLVLGSRTLDLLRYRRLRREHALSEMNEEKWHRRFLLKGVATAALVGLSVPLFAPDLQDPELRLMLFFYIFGVSTGALSTLYPDTPLITAYLSLSTLPMMGYFFTQQSHYSTVEGMVILLYLLILLLIAHTMRKLFRTLQSQADNLRRNRKELALLFDQTPTPIFYYDTEMKVRKYNQAFQRFFDKDGEIDLQGFDLRRLNFRRAVEAMEGVLETGEPHHYEGVYFSTFNPREYWIKASVVPVYDEREQLRGGIVHLHDKTIEKEHLRQLQEVAHQDTLTGLGNRRKFLFTLRALVEEGEKRPCEICNLLYFIDLNQFKSINDTLGHPFGDRILQEVSKLVSSLLPEGATLFRYGGDEFILLAPTDGEENEERLKARAADLAVRIDRILEERLTIDGTPFPLSASVGIVLMHRSMSDADEIIRQADISMYQAKKLGLPYAFYDREMDHERQKDFFLRQSLRAPTLEEELHLFLQPIVDTEGRITAAEALVRWEHPQKGWIPPDEFIPVAAESGQIHRIGRWMIDRTCELLGEILRRNPHGIDYLSVNIDARELSRPDFVEQLERSCGRHRIDPKRLVFEITENTLVDNFERLTETTEALERLGFRWAIDDFGVGYSSLSYLQRFSLSILKLDKCFTQTIPREKATMILIDHILSFADHMGYEVVIEGVENEEQLDYLHRHYPRVHCQGFHFYRPVPRAKFLELIEDRLEEDQSDQKGGR